MTTTVKRIADDRLPELLELRPVVPQEVPRALRRSPSFSVEVDAVPAEEGPRLGRGAEGLCRVALRRQLEDAGAVGEQPELRDEPPPESLGRELELEDEDRPEHGEILEADPVGRVPLEELALLLS